MSDAINLVAETAERLFADMATPEVARAAEEGTWPGALWRAAEETGFASALEPASGVSLAEALAILRAAGRHAAPIPLAETMLARALAARAGLAVPDGPLTVPSGVETETLGLVEEGLTGTLHRVPFARQAACVVALARAGERPVIVAAKLDGARLRLGRSLAGEPRDGVRFERVPLPAEAVRRAPVGIDDAWLLRMGALLRSAQLVGALERVLEASVAYANERVQFGRPIGRFQAIQHQLAALGGEVAASAAMLDVAAEAVAAGAERADLAVAAAKARASEAAGIAASIAHQVHGAIGFTREFALQHFTRRLLAWRDEYGSEAYWHGYLGRDVLAANAGPLWPRLATL